MHIGKLAPLIGGEVTDIDLRRPVDVATRRQLNEAAVEHIALVIRGQSFTAEHYLAAASLFGAPMEQHTAPFALPDQPLVHEVSSLAKNSAGQPLMFGGRWHTDHSDHDIPPKYTMLYAIKLPDKGGGTSFVSMRASYQTLSADCKQRIADLRTVTQAFGATRRDDGTVFPPPAVHPLVRTNPENGAKALYFHPNKTDHIVGMTPTDSQALLDELMAHTLRPEFIYTHQWKMGDMLIWDNRAVMHKANFDFDPAQNRLLYRVMIAGERPR